MNQKNNVMTTQEAARYLGVSATSVQKMVARGELTAWVTQGGHRRIYRDSVERFAQSIRGAANAAHMAPQCLRILMAEDEPDQVSLVQRVLEAHGAPFELTVANDASQALIQLERQRPDVVFTDLIMEPFDGFHLVRTIVAEPAYADIAVLVISGLEPREIEARGGLPPGVQVYRKPLPVERMFGFLDALSARGLRRAATLVNKS